MSHVIKTPRFACFDILYYTAGDKTDRRWPTHCGTCLVLGSINLALMYTACLRAPSNQQKQVLSKPYQQRYRRHMARCVGSPWYLEQPKSPAGAIQEAFINENIQALQEHGYTVLDNALDDGLCTAFQQEIASLKAQGKLHLNSTHLVGAGQRSLVPKQSVYEAEMGDPVRSVAFLTSSSMPCW